jgi:hypothetical protein
MGLKTEKGKSMAAQGHAQVELKKNDGTGAHRAVLGFWDESWQKDDPTMAQLFSVYRASLSALQRHQETNDFAALKKARGGPQTPPDERIERRHLDREMGVLEAVDLDRITADISARRNALSPFKIAIDRTDVDGATQRAEQRALLRSLPPLERLKALRADMPEFTAAAILSAPPTSSALSDSEWGNFREARLRQLYPDKLASLDAANAAVKLTARCLDAARSSTRERILPFLPPVEPEQKTIAQPWVA